MIKAPHSIGSTRARINGKDGQLFDDLIMKMTFDGEILEETSMLEAVDASGLIGLYQGAFGEPTNVDTNDPLHLNSIQLVGEEIAAAHDWLNADDLLVSFRNISAVVILDGKTYRSKWRAAGTTLRQHSPRFLDSNRILVFDNYGGDVALGGTRLAVIRIDTRRAETIFPTGSDTGFGDIFSDIAGQLCLNRDRSAVLMAVTNQSKVFEIDLNNRAVLWEYHLADKLPTKIWTAKYCYNVSFEMNQKEGTK